MESFGCRSRIVVDEVRHDRLVMVEKRLHIHDQILDHGKPQQWFHGDRVALEVLHENLAGKAVGRLEPEDIGESGLDTRRRVEP